MTEHKMVDLTKEINRVKIEEKEEHKGEDDWRGHRSYNCPSTPRFSPLDTSSPPGPPLDTGVTFFSCFVLSSEPCSFLTCHSQHRYQHTSLLTGNKGQLRYTSFLQIPNNTHQLLNMERCTLITHLNIAEQQVIHRNTSKELFLSRLLCTQCCI